MVEKENVEGNDLKQQWKGFGKGMGKSFSNLGKSIIKSAKVATDKADDWAQGNDNEVDEQPTGLKESWAETGKTIGNTAAAFGKSLGSTAKHVLNEIDEKIGS